MAFLIQEAPPIKFYGIERVRFPRLRVLAEALAEVFTLWREKYFPGKEGGR